MTKEQKKLIIEVINERYTGRLFIKLKDALNNLFDIADMDVDQEESNEDISDTAET